MTHPLQLGDRYQLDARIGAGGMGEVWRATDLILRRQVAVKLLRPEMARDDSALAQFRSEAQSAASVTHPNVAQVYDYSEGSSSEQPYLVMELVDGTSLDQHLGDGPLEPAFTMDIVAQAARGLAAAHASGLVHRDVKPQNLLVTGDGRVKITDFGIARAAGSALNTSTGMLACTPAYVAPERAGGAAATPATDLYALGIVAYQCLTGRLPFTGEPLAVLLAHRSNPLPPLPPSVPAQVAALVTAMTAKEPQARPASAGQVAAQATRLRAALAEPSAATRPSVATGRASATRPSAITRPSAAAGPVAATGRLAVGAGGSRGWWRWRPRRPAALAGRAGLALVGVAVLGAGGWMVAHLSGPTAAHHHVSGRPAATSRPSTHPSRTVLPVDSPTATLRHNPPSAPPPSPAHQPTPAGPSPSQSPTPQQSPTPSVVSPPPSPEPSPSATVPPPSPSTPEPSVSPTATSPGTLQ